MADSLEDSLRLFVASYVESVRGLSLTDVKRRQSPPYASLGAGAGGIAFALWRHGTLGDPISLQEAGRWLDEAMAIERQKAAFEIDPNPFEVGRRRMLYYGVPGLLWLRAVLAHSLHHDRGFDAAIARLARLWRRERFGPPTYMDGLAGHLLGATLLLRHTGDRRLEPVTDQLAAALLRTAGSGPWRQVALLGFAVGRAGVLFALLEWSRTRGKPLPRWLLSRIEAHARKGVRRGRGVAWPLDSRRRRYLTGWCNGTAGHALLLVKAYEVTREPFYLRRARAAARHSFHFRGGYDGALCCGEVGSAYACLALDRIDPGRGWELRAKHLALLGALKLSDAPWSYGLLRGTAGLCCLSLDLLHKTRRKGFPLVEG